MQITTKKVNTIRNLAAQAAYNASNTAMLQVLNAYVVANKVNATRVKYAKTHVYTANTGYVLCYVTKYYVQQINSITRTTIHYTTAAKAQNVVHTQTQQLLRHNIKCVSTKTFNKYVKQVAQRLA